MATSAPPEFAPSIVATSRQLSDDWHEPASFRATNTSGIAWPHCDKSWKRQLRIRVPSGWSALRHL